MPQPLVAIVTPVYNGAAYLAETMESVQAQSWTNLVHVILDNNSSDETAQIIDRYRNGRVPLLVFRNETTLHMLDNWNSAVARAPDEAEYIRVLCADDTFYPNSTEKMVKLAEADPEIGVVGSLHYCDGGVGDFLWPSNRSVFDGVEAIRMILLGEGVLMPVQMMFRKRYADPTQPFYPRMKDPSGPYDMVAMMDLLSRSKFGFVNECLGFTRVHANSISATLFGQERASWTRDCLHYLQKFGPTAFGGAYREHLLRFRRYYVRRILLWRRRGMAEADIDKHVEALADAGWSLNVPLVADAMLDWALIRVGLRRNWTGYPGWQ